MSMDAMRLKPLEIFLLVFVKSGLSTTYDLLSRIDVGVGASSPALKRLEEEGLLTCIPGPRNRMQFVMTEEGDKQLRAALDEGPRQYWRKGRDTFDSLHRAILLGWVTSRPEDAKRCIAEAGEILRGKAGRDELDAGNLRRAVFRLRDKMINNEEPIDDSLLIATVYRWIGAEMNAAKFRLQAEILPVLDTLVRELPPAPEIWTDTPSDQQTLLEP